MIAGAVYLGGDPTHAGADQGALEVLALPEPVAYLPTCLLLLLLWLLLLLLWLLQVFSPDSPDDPVLDEDHHRGGSSCWLAGRKTRPPRVLSKRSRLTQRM